VRVEATASLCTGCKICQLACSLHQFDENNPKKTGILISSNLLVDGHYRIAICDQCGICEEVCPTEAIRKTDDGVYRIDGADCVLCYACVNECPLHAMVLPRGEELPVKCIACGECVELCPTSALALVG
jgi:formate hydrogenlyase subunit 6/NADH:ubiquinone oxidoreductase subunit I